MVQSPLKKKKAVAEMESFIEANVDIIGFDKKKKIKGKESVAILLYSRR